MPQSSNKRARGKHYGNRVHHTGNKFLITSAEGQLLSKQIDFVQRNMMQVLVGLHNRITALEPAQPDPAAGPTLPEGTPEVVSNDVAGANTAPISPDVPK